MPPEQAFLAFPHVSVTPKFGLITRRSRVQVPPALRTKPSAPTRGFVIPGAPSRLGIYPSIARATIDRRS
jgi:hypothetical protein